MKKIDWRMRVLCAVATAAVVTASPANSASREVGPQGCSKHFYGLEPISRLAIGVEGAPYNSVTESLTGPIEKLINNLPKERKSLNVLVLSGGGQWGAYGAGFLNGWAEHDAKADPASGHVRRDQIDMLFAISTGAMQSGLVYPAFSSDPAKKKAAAETLERHYTSKSVKTLLRSRGLGDLLLNHNSLKDPSNLIKQVSDGVDAFYPDFEALPQTKRLYLGLVNLDRNQFFAVDVKGIVTDQFLDDGKRKACVMESVLASAAAPLYFPPRFIDDQMYVDGGVRLGHFSTSILNHEKIILALLAKGVALNLSVIVNGNLDANHVSPGAIKAVSNTFTSILAAVMPNMLDQIYKDSNLRVVKEIDPRTSPSVRFTYVSNKTILESSAGDCATWRKRGKAENEETFNLPFMKCIYAIGYERGLNQNMAMEKDANAAWFSEFQTAAIRKPPPLP